MPSDFYLIIDEHMFLKKKVSYFYISVLGLYIKINI